MSSLRLSLCCRRACIGQRTPWSVLWQRNDLLYAVFILRADAGELVAGGAGAAVAHAPHNEHGRHRRLPAVRHQGADQCGRGLERQKAAKAVAMLRQVGWPACSRWGFGVTAVRNQFNKMRRALGSRIANGISTWLCFGCITARCHI